MINVRLLVNGTVLSDHKNLLVDRALSDNKATSNFYAEFDNPAGRHSSDFTVGAEVKVYAGSPGSTNIFTGILEEINFNGEENTQFVSINGRDYSARLLDSTVSPIVYTDSEISTIVKNIVDNNIANISYSGVQTTDVTLKRIAFNDISTYEAIKQLSDLAGYTFYVDVNKDLHFEPIGSSATGITLDNTNILQSSFNTTREGMANIIKVYGDRYLSGFKEKLTAGSPVGGSVFTLQYKPHNTNIDYLGSSMKGAIFETTVTPTSGPQYLVNFNDRQIVFVSGTSLGYNSIPASGGSFIVTYDRDLPIIKKGTNRDSITLYGPKTKIINDKSIKDPNTALDILKAELENANPFKSMDVKLKGWQDITPGQTINMNLSNFGIAESGLSVIQVKYDFNKRNVLADEIISVNIDKKLPDVTDQLTELKKRLELLEAQDRQNTDTLTSLETSTGSLGVLGSHWEVWQRGVADSFIAGHPLNGVLGTVSSRGTGSFSLNNFVPGNNTNTYNYAMNCIESGLGVVIWGRDNSLKLGSADDFTVSTWVYPSGAQKNHLARIFEWGYAGGWYPGAVRTSSGTNLGLSFPRFDGTTAPTVTVNNLIPINQWSHIACKYDNGSRYMFAYFNGSLVGSTADTTTLSLMSGLQATSNSAYFGNTTARDRSFIGYMDDFRLINRALSTAEIGSEYNRRYNNDRLLAWYKFDENAGSLFYNSASIEMPLEDAASLWRFNESGANFADEAGLYNGSAILSPTMDAGVFFNGSALAIGSPSYIFIPAYGSFAPGQPMSVAAWFKTLQPGSTQVIVGARQSNDLWKLGINAGSAQFNYDSVQSGASVEVKVSGLGDRWNHMAGVYTGSLIKLYYNGDMVGSSTNRLFATTNCSGINIGKRADATGEYFSGLIDEVRIYNRELSDGEVANLYSGKTIQPLLGDRRAGSTLIYSGGYY